MIFWIRIRPKLDPDPPPCPWGCLPFEWVGKVGGGGRDPKGVDQPGEGEVIHLLASHVKNTYSFLLMLWSIEWVGRYLKVYCIR